MDFEINMFCMFFCGFSAGIIFVILFGYQQNARKGFVLEKEHVKLNSNIKIAVNKDHGLPNYTNILKLNVYVLRTKLALKRLSMNNKKSRT